MTASTTIMLVSKSGELFESVRRLAQPFSYELTVQQNGMEALKAIRDAPPSLVITELHLEDLNGLRLIELLRNGPEPAFQAVPVLMVSLTAINRILLERLAKHYGAYAFLPFPCDSKELLEQIQLPLQPELITPEARTIFTNSGAIMVLDDDRGLLNILERHFRSLKLKIRTYYRYKDFIADFERYRPQAVILDVAMPDRSGLEVLAEVKRIDPTVPCIIITAHGSEEVAVAAFRLGVSDYFNKPFDPDTLHRKLTAVIRTSFTASLIDEITHALFELDRTSVDLKTTCKKLNEVVDQLTATKSSLEELNRFKTSFLASCAHDLKAPLASIISSCINLLEYNEEQLSPKVREAISAHRGGSMKLLTIIQNLLDIDKLESGHLRLFLSREAPASVLHYSVEAMQAYAAMREVTLELTLAELPDEMTMDKQKLERVLHNLIANAIKYSVEGGKITVSARVEGEYLSIEISDQGIGIDAEDIPKLFRKYSILTPSSDSISSTGLGLFLCKEFVTLHHGEINLVSSPGKGSTFTVRMPLDLEPRLHG